MESRRAVIEPAPEETLIMRGVMIDFRRRGAKASTTRKGPVEFVRKVSDICSEREPPERATAALLTRASSLGITQCEFRLQVGILGRYRGRKKRRGKGEG